MIKRLFLLTILSGSLLGVALGGLWGCAYSMGTEGRRLPDGYQLVSVPVFKNSTQEVGVEVPFTNAIIREFARSRVAKVVDTSAAQVILEGYIEKISFDVANQINCPAEPCPIIPKNTVLNSEYRISVFTKLVLRRASDGHVLWAQQFSGQKSYLAPKIGVEGLNSANALYNQSSRQQNLTEMAGDIMAEAHGRLTENF